MRDELKEVISSFNSVLEGLHLFLTTSLSRERLNAENERARNKFALELGQLVEKLRSLGIVSPAPPRPGPKPQPQRREPPSSTLQPRAAGQSSVQQRDLSRDVHSDHTCTDNGILMADGMYTDMQQGENANDAKQEEFYTDMDTIPESGVIQDELYTAMDAENEPEQHIEQELYTDVDLDSHSERVKESADSTDDEDVTRRGPDRPPSTAFSSTSSIGSFDSSSAYAQFSGTKFKKFKASSLKTATKAGYVEKLGGYRQKTWQKRYCILDDICLFFYGSQKDKAQNNQVLLVDYNVTADVTEIKEKKNFLFKLSPTNVADKSLKTYFFRVPEQGTRDEWVTAISAACQKGAGMGKRRTVFLQYHDEVGTNSASTGVEQIQPDNDELHNDAALAAQFSITSSHSSEESDFVATPITRRKPQPPPMITEPNVKGPPNLMPLPPRPDSPVNTEQIYFNDKWFNYCDVCVALWDCHGMGASELTVKRGDLVLIVEKVNTDWWLVTLQSEDDDFKGKSGLVPSAYLDFAFETV